MARSPPGLVRDFAVTTSFSSRHVRDYLVARFPVRAWSVRRLLNILAYLTIALSLGTTATAHVLERPDVSVSSYETGVDEVAMGHAPGDSDQVPSDRDKEYPHHHGGCHGDHVAAPVKATNTALTGDLRLAPIFASHSMRPLSTADPALRPPQA